MTGGHPRVQEGGLALVKIMVLLGATVGGGIGWWLGSHFGIMTGFFLSVIGTAAGVYFARRWVS
jgi:apolipoprotein N-acyltransferase